MANPPRWQGEIVACIASGPSLTPEDCGLIGENNIRTIAVNRSWELAPFADIIYGGDNAFWTNYGKHINVPAERWTCSRTAADRFKISFHANRYGAFNSGLRAIELALEFGAAKIILLGYDCTTKYGTHWHGDHKATANPNGNKCEMWRKQFSRLAKSTKIPIINCSSVTTLECFTKQPLEETLSC